jgi:hypothetical protein
MGMTVFARSLTCGALLLSGLLAELSVAPAAAQSPSPAAAQGAAEPAENPEVEKLVTTAIASRAQGRDLEALETLKKAAEIDPGSVRVQVHLANVYQALGEWLAADQYLRLALAQANHPYVMRHRKALEDARGVIEDNLGMLEVDGEPVGAEVRLNGRLVGTLPLAAPIPVTVGSYTLEVKREGHYPASRPIVIAGHSFIRESVRLERLSTDELETRTFPIAAGTDPGHDATLDLPRERPWLTWTLAGLGAAAAVTSLGAVVYREVHANHWNDDSRCLALGQTRAELCGGERDKVETAEDVAIATGAAAGLFTAGALLNALVFSAPSSPRTGLAGCSLSPEGASCFGSF